MNTQPPKPSQWYDLAARVASGVVMIVVGVWAMWMGHHVFHVFVALVCGVMIWELARMIAPAAPGVALQSGAISAVALLATPYMAVEFSLPLLLASVLVGVGQFKQYRVLFFVYAVLVLLAGKGMISVRDDLGFVWILWLVVVVVVTDIAGYFAGRLIGGPKFWPSISPKKTWSGTAAGWIGAAVVGFIFMGFANAGLGLVAISVVASFASQMGDIAESAIKRKMDVKDSSNLIPGHGGVLDRCDGLLGASVFLFLIAFVFGFQPGLG